MTRIIALFNLRPGVSAEDYERWARTSDLVIARGLKAVESFNIYRSAAVLGSDAPPPYQYFEVLDVLDVGLLGEEASQSQAMQEVVATFHALADNPQLIIVEDIEGAGSHNANA
jgi:hypothetical protein